MDMAMSERLRPVRAAVHRAAARWFARLPLPWRHRRPEPSQVTAEYLRQIYRNLAFSTPVSLIMVMYLTALTDPQDGAVLRWWSLVFCIFLTLRWAISLAYPRDDEVELTHVRGWSVMSVLVQGANGLLIAALALFVIPTLELYAQVVGTMVVLILVGATAFSLSGRWIDTLVYAPPIYFSFAWSTSLQSHPYAEGVSALIVMLFILHLVYAANHRKSIWESFVVARRSAELARELQFKNIEFQEVASARSRLLATVSHDLRQPAHAIGLLSERALVDTSFSSVKASLRDLNELSQSLSASLTTLMDLTRLDAGMVKASIGPVSLGQVLRRLNAEFGASARAKGLRWEVDQTECWVQSDPVLLHGVLANLVSNAIKYTRQGGIEVKVSDRRSSVQVQVIDTGIGIPVSKLDLIFQEFVRLDASDAGTEGLGLGLSIVRRYAALLSHTLSVQSQPGQGSRFGISLARIEAPPPSEQALVAPAKADADYPLRGLKVLVIDNVELLLVSITKTMMGWGCEVQSARNLGEALERATQCWPDLVVSDHHLGDREPNGIELIAALRQLGLGQGRPMLPALLMTGDVSAPLEAQAREVGVQVLHKPVRPSVFRAHLLELMGRAAAAESAKPSAAAEDKHRV
jgi:signal transduction histidine kinase/CheY-like chemotaxis protein